MASSRMEITLTPELLSRPFEAPAEIAPALPAAHGADVAEAVNRLDQEPAAQVISALPFEFAVRVVGEPRADTSTSRSGPPGSR